MSYELLLARNYFTLLKFSSFGLNQTIAFKDIIFVSDNQASRKIFYGIGNLLVRFNIIYFDHYSNADRGAFY